MSLERRLTKDELERIRKEKFCPWICLEGLRKKCEVRYPVQPVFHLNLQPISCILQATVLSLSRYCSVTENVNVDWTRWTHVRARSCWCVRARSRARACVCILCPPLPKHVQTGPCAHPASISVVSGVLSLWQRAQSVRLTSDLQLAPRLRISGSTPLIPSMPLRRVGKTLRLLRCTLLSPLHLLLFVSNILRVMFSDSYNSWSEAWRNTWRAVWQFACCNCLITRCDGCEYTNSCYLVPHYTMQIWSQVKHIHKIFNEFRSSACHPSWRCSNLPPSE